MNATTKRRKRKNSDTHNVPSVVLNGETPEVTTKGETGLSVTSDVSGASGAYEGTDEESTESEAIADLSEAEESEDESNIESEEESEDGSNSEPQLAGIKKPKQKRTLTVFEVQSMYGTGGVEAVKAFAEKEKRAITIAPIEKALQGFRLIFDDAEAYKKKCAPLEEFLSFLKAQPGTGKGKRATYTVNGAPSQFKVQRPVNKQTKRKSKPMTVIPLKALKLKEGVDHVWVKFTDDEIRIRRDKNFA